MSESAAFTLALLRIDGVGRVTAQRLLAHFATYDALRETPREQVLLRIKGAPRAADLVTQLFDEDTLRPLLDQAARVVETFESQSIAVLTQHDERWPDRLNALDLSDRPPVLYAYGDTDVLARPAVALFARPPLPGPAFEVAQDLVRALIRHGIVVMAGVEHGFDVVVHKLCASANAPSVLVTNAGMSRIAKPMRPVVSASVRAGGLLLSPFPPDHGPYPHDDAERALTMAALARASAFFSPQPDSHEERALTWCLEHDRPAFGIAGDEPLPERVHALDRPIDLDWVVAAASPEGNA